MEKIKGFFSKIGKFTLPLICDKDNEGNLKLSVGRILILIIAGNLLYSNIYLNKAINTQMLQVFYSLLGYNGFHKISPSVKKVVEKIQGTNNDKKLN